MAQSSDITLARTRRLSSVTRAGTLAILVALAGCATPREAATPAPEPTSRLGTGDYLETRIARGAVPLAPEFATASTRIDDLPADLQALWRRTKLPASSLSLVVAEIGQPPLVAINPTQPRNPASVMKLVTTYAALEALGPNHTWRTELLAASAIQGDTLPSALYIRSGGDPYLRLEDAWRMLRELRLRGIRRIPGIVIDRSIFGDVAIDPGAFDNAPDRVYNASPDALVMGFGAVRLLYLPDTRSGRWQVVLDPPLPGVQVDNRVRASKAVCSGSPAVKTEQRTEGGTLILRLSGTVALSCGEFTQYRLALAQPEHTARVLQAMWRDLGGELTGPIIDGVVPSNAITLVTHESPPLSDLIRPINKASNNVMARMMLLALAQAYGNDPATPASGVAALQRALAEQNLVFPELQVENGSGLSRDGRISAASLTALLHTAWLSPRMPEFISSMAIAGEDGTARRRWASDNARGRAHLKTGTLRDASALAGYVTAASGRRFTVVAMVNDPKAYTARAFANGLIEWLAQR